MGFIEVVQNVLVDAGTNFAIQPSCQIVNCLLPRKESQPTNPVDAMIGMIKGTTRTVRRRNLRDRFSRPFEATSLGVEIDNDLGNINYF